MTTTTTRMTSSVTGISRAAFLSYIIGISQTQRPTVRYAAIIPFWAFLILGSPRISRRRGRTVDRTCLDCNGPSPLQHYIRRSPTHPAASRQLRLLTQSKWNTTLNQRL